MQVALTSLALADLREQYLYIARANPRAAEHVVGQVEHACLVGLAHNPSSGRAYRGDVRVMLVGRYRVFHRQRDGRVEVLRILHQARDHRSVMRRDPMID